MSIIDFFISAAQAQTQAPASPGQGGGGMSLVLMMAIFLGFIYLTVWRPQNKKAKEHRDMIDALTQNDEVITSGGIVGSVSKITMSYVVVKVAPNTEITFQKSAIVNVLPKGTLKSI